MKKNKLLQISVVVLSAIFVVLGGIIIKDNLDGTNSAQIYGGNSQDSSINQKEINIQPVVKSILLFKNPILSPSLDYTNEKILFYEKATGFVFSSDFNGKKLEQISETPLPNLIYTLWSPNSKEVISFFREKTLDIVKKYFNYDTKRSSLLNKNIISVAFSPSGKKIVYNFLDYNDIKDEGTGNGNISISNPDGSSFVSIFKTRIKNMQLAWPKDNLIAFLNKDQEIKTLFFIDNNGSNFIKAAEGHDLEIVWSKDGNYFLYSISSGNEKTELYIQDSVLKYAPKLASISASAKNCAWSINDQIIYCSTNDGIYKININNGEKNIVVPNERAKQLFLNSTEDHLVYIDNNDLLYSYKIK